MKESAMMRQSKMFTSMKKLYESKMAAMNRQVHRAQAQRDKLQQQIQNIGSTVEAEKKRLKAQLVAKLRSTEKQLEHLKRKQREFEKLKRLQARAKQRLRDVKQELDNMRRLKVAQVRALEAAKKEFRSKVLLKSREILSLRREANKERTLLRKLQNQEAKREVVLKRRMEDLAAQNRRLKEAQKRNRRIKCVAQHVCWGVCGRCACVGLGTHAACAAIRVWGFGATNRVCVCVCVCVCVLWPLPLPLQSVVRGRAARKRIRMGRIHDRGSRHDYLYGTHRKHWLFISGSQNGEVMVRRWRWLCPSSITHTRTHAPRRVFTFVMPMVTRDRCTTPRQVDAGA